MSICCGVYKYSTSVLIGLCAGIALSLILTPLLEEECSLQGASIPIALSRSLQSQEDDYEPKYNLEAKPKKRQKEPKKIIRPRFYSSELGIKEKLFIGIFTTQDTLHLLGVALNRTLAHHTNKLVFFLHSNSQSDSFLKLLSTVVVLNDDRPLLRPFHVLRYVSEHYAKDYDFFFFLPDNSYLRGEKLRSLVEHISVSQTTYMGQPMDGGHTFYCSVGSGFLIGQGVLMEVVKNLDWCVKNAFSDHIDDNLGRCILHSINVPCASEIQGQRFNTFELAEDFYFQVSIKTLSQLSAFNSALTIYPVPDADAIYRLHRYFSERDLEEVHQQIEELQTAIRNLSRFEPQEGNSSSWPLGYPSSFKAVNRFDVLQWDYFTETHLYLDSDFSNVRKLEGASLMDVKDVLNKTVRYIRAKYGDRFRYQRLLNGYRRFDPTRGMEYILDVAFFDTKVGKEARKRIESLRPLGKIELVPIPYVTENTRITLLLPVNVDNRARISRFLEDYARVCLENQDNTALSLIFVYDPMSPGKGDKNDVFLQIKTLVSSYANKYRTRGAKLSWISIKIPGRSLSEFGMMDLTVRKFPPDTLFLLCTPDMEIRMEYLNRVRMNTILGWQIFSSIPFVQYHPKLVYPDGIIPETIEINKSHGHYDIHNFDYMSFYASDYIKGRKVVEQEIPIVRLDKDLHNEKHRHLRYGIYHMFLKTAKLHIFRAVEPSLRVFYTDKKCEPTLNEDAYHSCLLSRAEALASRSQLAALILQQPKKEKKRESPIQISNQKIDVLDEDYLDQFRNKR